MRPALLSRALVFPPAESAGADGLVAYGGDLSPERIVLAYSQGIFPWPSPGYPLLWFSPEPRFVLEPSRAHLARSLRKRLRQTELEIRADTAFDQVIAACSELSRPGQQGTWITNALREGYTELHRLGYAHSIEAWRGAELVGGLYGVSMGRIFFGESMFAREADASKVAFSTLLAQLVRWGHPLVDCQVRTDHLARFGAVDRPRREFLRDVAELVSEPTLLGPWKLELTPARALTLLDQARLDVTES